MEMWISIEIKEIYFFEIVPLLHNWNSFWQDLVKLTKQYCSVTSESFEVNHVS